MSIQKTVYSAILDRLKTYVPELKTIRLFNNQFANENRENAFDYPAAFIEFRRMDYDTAQQGYQKGNYTVSIHMGFVHYETETLVPFDLIHKIYSVLQGFQGATFTSLMRTTDIQDVNHDNLIVWRTDFDFMATDCPDLINKVETTITELEINRDLDIDNQVIRTGDGI